jgi:hypothetical protein
MLSAAVCATDGCHAQTGSLIIAVLTTAGSQQVCVCAFDGLFVLISLFTSSILTNHPLEHART